VITRYVYEDEKQELRLRSLRLLRRTNARNIQRIRYYVEDEKKKKPKGYDSVSHVTYCEEGYDSFPLMRREYPYCQTWKHVCIYVCTRKIGHI